MVRLSRHPDNRFLTRSVAVDEILVDLPRVFDTLTGFKHKIKTEPALCVGDDGYQFDAWEGNHHLLLAFS